MHSDLMHRSGPAVLGPDGEVINIGIVHEMPGMPDLLSTLVRGLICLSTTKAKAPCSPKPSEVVYRIPHEPIKRKSLTTSSMDRVDIVKQGVHR
jgi:hypothetical protein